MSSTAQYAPNISGLRQYLNQELTSTSRDYARLNTRLEQLERQDQFAFRASLVPFGLGIGTFLVGTLLRQDEEPTDPRLKSAHEKGGRLMLYGAGGVALGFLVNSLLEPGDKDVQDFIRYHNGEIQARGDERRSPPLSLQLLQEDTLVSLHYAF